MKKFGKRIGGAILTLAFVFGISAVTGFTAQAQNRNDDGQYQRRHRDGDDKRDKQRQWERNRNRDDNQAESRAWRRDRDWNRDSRDGRYGNNGSYDRNRGYGNNGGYNNTNQIELNQGYQAGLNTGASDAQRGQSFNPQRSHYYKNANSQAFRQGFVQGYDQGYRQYSGYGNGNYRTSDNGVGGIGSILGGILGRP
jgi:hypothetical protein